MKEPAFLVRRSFGVLVLGCLGLGLIPARALASEEDPLLVVPEVMLLMDTSGSMLFGAYGAANCSDPPPPIPQPGGPALTCDYAFCVRSGKRCADTTDRPPWNPSFLWDGERAWLTCGESYGLTNGVIQNEAAYQGSPTCLRNRMEVLREILTGGFCQSPDGPWSAENCCTNMGCCDKQAGDGVLDAYKDMLRFGFASFDNSSFLWSYGTNGDYGIKGRETDQVPGRLIDVVYANDEHDLAANNRLAQNELCGLGVGGGSPINYSLDDLRAYFQGNHYRTELGLGPDPMASCRDKYVVFLSDGEQSPEHNAFGPPESFAQALCDQGIPVLVVGFGDAALSSKLQAIAAAGSNPNCMGLDDDGAQIPPLSPFVATDPIALRQHFRTIFNSILAGVSSRTSLTSTAPDLASGSSYVYGSYFQISREGRQWKGYLTRQKVGVAADGSWDWIQTASPCDGTNQLCFHQTLKQKAWDARSIYTVARDPRSQTCQGSLTCTYPRPVGTSVQNNLIQFKLGNDTSLQGPMCQSTLSTADTLIKHVLGDPLTNPDGVMLGDIFHSNLEVVPPPTALTEDFRYEAFFRANKDRYTMLYVGANDGMLHAFVAEDKKVETVGGSRNREGEELWGFIPSNLLATLYKMRQGHATYVDGSPVVQDAFFHNAPLMDPANPSQPLKVNNQPLLGAYKSVLISGERGGGDAYFALDVTDPENPRYLWEYRTGLNTKVDYEIAQCAKRETIEGWAEPIIGQIWLKNAGSSNTFASKSVMIVPGGYIDPQDIPGVTSCIQFLELVGSSASIHVVDIETGKLLKKLSFGDGFIEADLQAKIDQYYTALVAASGSANKKWTEEFSSDGKGGGWAWGNKDIPADGWFCKEERDDITKVPEIPASIIANCQVIQNDGVKYVYKCCVSDDCEWKQSGSCYYYYEKSATALGGMLVQLKQNPSCVKGTNKTDQGKLRLVVGDSFWPDNVTATPAAFNTSRGEYITRIFVPTYKGKIFRVDTGIAEFDGTRPEGAMLGSFSANNASYGWRVDKWWPIGTDTSLGRPIMITPAMALSYDRSLVLFFGTGQTSDLEWKNTRDKLYAVKETFTVDTLTNTFRANTQGTAFERNAADGVFSLAAAERLISRPLVIAGQVFFTTYTPNNDSCGSGSSRVYQTSFDTLAEAALRQTSVGITEGPRAFWTPTGMDIATKSGNEVKKLMLTPEAAESLLPSHHVLYWGKVL